jgi:hypothetical protein
MKKIYNLFYLVFLSILNRLDCGTIDKYLGKVITHYKIVNNVDFDNSSDVTKIDYFSFYKPPTPHEGIKNHLYYKYSTYQNRGMWKVYKEREIPEVEKKHYMHGDDSILGKDFITQNFKYNDCVNGNYPNFLVLAFHKNKLVGQTRLHEMIKSAYVNDLMVHREYRGNRVANNLMTIL